MPKRSDCPYPEIVCSEIHDATTFEHYQTVAWLSAVKSNDPTNRQLNDSTSDQKTGELWLCQKRFSSSEKPPDPSRQQPGRPMPRQASKLDIWMSCKIHKNSRPCLSTRTENARFPSSCKKAWLRLASTVKRDVFRDRTGPVGTGR
jgi:hypothetical protein